MTLPVGTATQTKRLGTQRLCCKVADIHSITDSNYREAIPPLGARSIQMVEESQLKTEGQN